MATSLKHENVDYPQVQEVLSVRAITGWANEMPLSCLQTLRALPFALAGLASIVVPVSGMADTSPTEVPKDLLQQGEYVARAGNCLSCHGEDLAGGYEVHTPLGTIVATNISPSKEYGIGNYSSDEFARAIREGVAHPVTASIPPCLMRPMSA